MKHQKSSYFWPSTVHFGFDTAGLVAREAAKREAKSAFIVVDSGVMKAGLLDVVLDSLYAANMVFTIYDKVKPNPDVASVNTVVKTFREAKADIIIGVGGGSTLDTAKAIKLMASGPASATVWDYATLLGKDRRPYPPPQKMPPYIAIPTTSGTGAEVTPWAVVTREDGAKFWVGDDTTIPDVALVDPALSFTLPPFLTAATGMDALTHLIEAYVSTRRHPLLDPLILYGIELVGRSLRPAVAWGKNKEARTEMMQAALIGGMAISSKLLGACHSLAHPLSGLAEVHHGLACGIMLPHQMAYSLIGAQARYADVAMALDAVWIEEASERERALGSVTAVTDLMTDIGLPTQLGEVGVAEELIPALAKAAYGDLNRLTNPRAVSEEELAELYLAAL